MKRILTAVLLAAAVAACTSAPETVDHKPIVVPPPPPPAAESTALQCDARELAYLVGKPKTDIPVPVNPSMRRVACTTCPVTMDFNPRRTNILFDADTGIVRQVKCG